MTGTVVDSYPSTTVERTTLTFCVEGLEPREELLVKALIRLLDHLTHQQWRYQPPDGKAHIHLLLAAPGTSAAFAARYGQLPPTLLELSHGAGNGHGHLSWPLRPDALEKELNRLGSLAVTRAAPVRQVSSTPLFTDIVTNQTRPLEAPAEMMRLQQWPPTHLLAGPGRMRLATLLTGRAMSMDELVYRSKLERRVCQTFVNELQHAGLLYNPMSSQPALATTSQTAEPSLAASSRPQEVRAAMLARSPLAPVGLLDRIRMRLRIGNLRGE